ncbi:MAG: GYDIA family GHMP kinase [Saprospiraceae bacterium]
MPPLPPFPAGQSFRAQGKLMLTGEYLVLDGAKALAVPTKPGQRLEVAVTNSPDVLHWESVDVYGKVWFEAAYTRKGLRTRPAAVERSPKARLARLLNDIFTAHPLIWPRGRGLQFRATLEFDRTWGLGSSATLSYLLAAFAGANPYAINNKEFGGSGYDIACAGADGPIVYQLMKGEPIVERLDWNPAWLEGCYLVHLGQKQDSREGIRNYRENAGSDLYRYAEELNDLTDALIKASDRDTAAEVLRKHEALVGYVTHQTPVGKGLFADFNGTVKSLGAWGGDFVLAVPTGQMDVAGYFASHGLTTCIAAKDLLVLPTSKVPIDNADPADWPVFLYGPLSEPRMDNQWLHGHLHHAADLLDHMIIDNYSAAPIPHRGGVVPGMLVYLSPEEILAMDIHPEGGPFKRSHARVRVGGTMVTALVWK